MLVDHHRLWEYSTYRQVKYQCPYSIKFVHLEFNHTWYALHNNELPFRVVVAHYSIEQQSAFTHFFNAICHCIQLYSCGTCASIPPANCWQTTTVRRLDMLCSTPRVVYQPINPGWHYCGSLEDLNQSSATR